MQDRFEGPKYIYLAGPIDNTDDPHTWRNTVKSMFSNDEIEFVDPTERYPGYNDNEEEVVIYGIECARIFDMLVCNIGEFGEETVGTHHEITEALYNGNKVAVVNKGDVSPFVEYRDVTFPDQENLIELFDTARGAIQYLMGHEDVTDVGVN